jgi:hypothetical protein
VKLSNSCSVGIDETLFLLNLVLWMFTLWLREDRSQA